MKLYDFILILLLVLSPLLPHHGITYILGATQSPISTPSSILNLRKSQLTQDIFTFLIELQTEDVLSRTSLYSQTHTYSHMTRHPYSSVENCLILYYMHQKFIIFF